MDEEVIETEVVRVGDRLRSAREAQKMSLEDVADRTRIPLRHLQSLEASDFEHLPAATYTVGFAKSYAGIVGLDRAEISDAIRLELGAPRYVSSAQTEAFEPADPKRSMPRGLVFGAIGAIIALLLLFTWLNNRSLNGGDETAQVPDNAVVAASQQPATSSVQPSGPIVIKANEPVWMKVYNKTGETYFSGILQPGQDFTVPATAVAPLLTTAKPEGLTISAGTQVVPTVGPAGKMISDVSLRPADLLGTGANPAPASALPQAQSATQAGQRPPQPQPRRQVSPQRPPVSVTPSEPAPEAAPPPQPTGN